MTEKIEKDLESKILCPKHHWSTAEPDKSIQQVQAAWKDDPSVCVCGAQAAWVSSDLRFHSETTASWKTGPPCKEGRYDFREDPGFLQNDEIQSHSLNACPKIFQNVKRIWAKWQKCFFFFLKNKNMGWLLVIHHTGCFPVCSVSKLFLLIFISDDIQMAWKSVLPVWEILWEVRSESPWCLEGVGWQEVVVPNTITNI